MTRQTIAQRRAKTALEQVREVAEANAVIRKAYVSYLEGLPATIIGIGLGQTVATLLARSANADAASGRDDGNAKAYRLLARHLERWLCQGWREGPYRAAPDSDDGRPGAALMSKIAEEDQDAYALARAEALAYLDWLKKLGVGLLKED